MAEVYIFRAEVTPYASEWRKKNVKHVFAHNLRERRLNLRETKDKMILGLFYKYRYVQYIAQKQVVLAIFVCLPVCHTPFVHSALERRRMAETRTFMFYGTLLV